jgi:hypothetical protein
MNGKLLNHTAWRAFAGTVAWALFSFFEAASQTTGSAVAVGTQTGSFQVIPIPDPKDKDNVFRINLGIYREKLYLQYHTASDGNVMGVFDGQTIQMIPNPVEAPDPKTGRGIAERGVVGDAIVYKDKLYLKYFSVGGYFCLAEYDGANFRIIPNPNSNTQYAGTVEPIVFNDNLYLQYKKSYAGVNHLVLEKFDGKNLNEIDLSTHEDYHAAPVVCNDRLYFLYSYNGTMTGLSYFDGGNSEKVKGPADWISSKPFGVYKKQLLISMPYNSGETGRNGERWALYDGKKFTPLPNPQNRGTLAGFPLVDKNNLFYFYQFTSGVQIAKYDGENATAFSNPPGSGKFSSGMTAYNGKVYARFSSNAVSLAQCDGTNVNLIQLPGVQNIKGFFVYRNKLFFMADNRLAEYDEHAVQFFDQSETPYYNGNYAIFQDKLFISYLGKFVRFSPAQ